MFHVVLFRPRIPQNTGAIVRLCANSGVSLHIVGPTGFVWDDRRLRRAGLDYQEWARIVHHDGPESALSVLPDRRFLLTTQGARRYTDVAFQADDVLVFGNETTGVPDDFRSRFDQDHSLYLPMVPGGRSINLANAVAITLFEAWRQSGFSGCQDRD